MLIQILKAQSKEKREQTHLISSKVHISRSDLRSVRLQGLVTVSVWWVTAPFYWLKGVIIDQYFILTHSVRVDVWRRNSLVSAQAELLKPHFIIKRLSFILISWSNWLLVCYCKFVVSWLKTQNFKCCVEDICIKVKLIKLKYRLSVDPWSSSLN